LNHSAGGKGGEEPATGATDIPTLSTGGGKISWQIEGLA